MVGGWLPDGTLMSSGGKPVVFRPEDRELLVERTMSMCGAEEGECRRYNQLADDNSANQVDYGYLMETLRKQ